MNKHLALLGIILLIGAVVRFAALGEVPSSLHRDEAFLGYNAYSILETGKDISGQVFPFHLESFLYSPAGYSYFSIPFIKLFDLSSFSVRFASAFFGFLTIFALFFLVKEFFYKNKYKNELALISSFFLAISPWHINLSRTATENTVVTFFIVLGIFPLLLFARKGKNLLLFLSFLSFGVTLSIYQAPRAFLPVFIPFTALLILGKKKLIEKRILLFFLYAFIIVCPVLFVVFSSDISLRIRTLSIFNHPEAQLVINSEIANDGEAGLPRVLTRVFHNKVVNYSGIFFDNYTKHFSFEYLFSDKGFPDRYRIPHMGILYIFELFLIISALFYIFRKDKREGLVILSWILLVPVGSALTFDDVPNLQRTLISSPAFSILSSYGLLSLLLVFKTKKPVLLKPFLIFISLVIVYSFSYYLIQYHIQSPVYRPWYRSDGYNQLVSSVKAVSDNYNSIVVTNRESAPTIFFLFFEKYEPQKFQNETRNADMSRSDSIGFGKYVFTDEECPLKAEIKTNRPILMGEKNILYVNSGNCPIPQNSKIIKTIKRADNSIVFYLLNRSD
ncbi:MAG: glycosyltransferase family 39 protein [Candidatus Levyibacteriota bacterium]